MIYVSTHAVLSHLHEDHFDNLVADHIRKSLPIVSTPHACENLKPRGHSALYPLQTWEALRISREDTTVTITSMPGKHTLGVADGANSVVNLIPPVMGSMVTFTKKDGASFNLYISGDTLYYDEMKVRSARVILGRWQRETDGTAGNTYAIPALLPRARSPRRHDAPRGARDGHHGRRTRHQAALRREA